jgi:hypothetical protein
MVMPRMSTPFFPLPRSPSEEHYGAYLDRMQASPEWDPRRNDAAILGCGHFGLPLARFAKAHNISTVYVGGLLQLLFGISGRRYVDDKNLGRTVFSGRARITRHWMPPLDSETPRNLHHVEGGAYW